MQERHGDRGLGLSALASVDLYRRNAFRLSGLPVDASLRQIRRRASEIEAAARLGDDGLITGDPLFPVRPQPPAEDVLTALQRIRDPNQRLLDEWFWLWPIPDLDVEGANAEEMRRAWSELAGSGRNHAAAAVHNLAVTAHRSALEVRREGKQITAAWKSSYRRWRQVLDDERCWEWLEHRVEAIGDPQLKIGAVAEIRSGLPALLLETHAGIAASLTGRPTRARLHVDAMRDSGFGRDQVDRALIGALQGAVSRLRALAERARAARAANESFDRVCLSIMDDAANDLKSLQTLVGEGHPVASGATDDLAAAMRECVVAQVNQGVRSDPDLKRRDYARAVYWLEQAAAIAGTGHAGTQIKADLATLSGNEVIAACNAAMEQAERAGTFAAQRELLEQTRKPMERLRKLDRDLHASLSDEIAGACYVMLVEHANKVGARGGDVAAVLPGLRKALDLARSTDLQGRIRKAIADIESLTRAVASTNPLLSGLSGFESEDQLAAALRNAGHGHLADQLGLGGGRAGTRTGVGDDRSRTRAAGRCATCGRYADRSRQVQLAKHGMPFRKHVTVSSCWPCSRKGLTTVPFSTTAAVLAAVMCCLGSMALLAMDFTLPENQQAWWWPMTALPLLPMLLAAPRFGRKQRLYQNVPEINRLNREGWFIVR